jgi:hypothetical protein
MDVIAKKYPDSSLYSYIEVLQYKGDPPQLLGTGGNASQNYPSDYDFFTKITTNETKQGAYAEFMRMVKDFRNRKDMYFIEFKVQDKDGEKIKFNSVNDLVEGQNNFDKYFNEDIDYCKWDFVLYKEQRFVELSMIYVFNKDPLDYDKLKLSLSNDFMDMVKEGKYYKSLKRLFALLKLEEPVKRQDLIKISKLFNSATGVLYQKNSELKAMKLLMEYNKEPLTLKRIKLSFKDLGFTNLDQLDDIIRAYDKLINEEGYKFLKHFYPYLLHNYKDEVIQLRGSGHKYVYPSRVLHERLISGGSAKSAGFVKRLLAEKEGKPPTSYTEPKAIKLAGRPKLNKTFKLSKVSNPSKYLVKKYAKTEVAPKPKPKLKIGKKVAFAPIQSAPLPPLKAEKVLTAKQLYDKERYAKKKQGSGQKTGGGFSLTDLLPLAFLL